MPNVPIDQRCWANKYPGSDKDKEKNPQCEAESVTEIGLCLEHYTYLTGRSPQFALAH